MTATALNYDTIAVGDALPGLETPPISRLTLALYCGASGDHNPIHVDTDFARAAGMPDVFAHGMLSMAWLGRVLTNWVPQQDLLEYSVRFAAITHVGERITCAGKVVEKLERAGRRCVRVELSTTNQDGLLKLAGEAVLAIA
ncbi:MULTISPECIES: MaoC family dehydratase [Simplicispira]|jgi:acyl dehydratase|uniref:Acyl dehydratase n=1 Tax=Simplicispira metamorpha TaxID=80881 RepID=A0A4V2SJG4_9BURK|nr:MULTISPECIES: MaoC family dehydratase [Simplicispira]MDD2690287.1 MaoC family dehydratase [Simplicispira sp.]TCP15026.1 acyl dehydratase [Simplicispira metamorpha]